MIHVRSRDSKQASDASRRHSASEPMRQPDLRFNHQSVVESRAASLSGALGFTHHLQTLQKTIGNQAVLRMLSRSRPSIQPKLVVNQPGDQYEQEADRVAEQVMRMPDPVPHATTSASNVLQRKCAACKGEEEKEGNPVKLSRKESGGAAAPPVVHEVLRSPGQPLDVKTRAFFEPRFRHDFNQVRIHADDKAAQSAREVHSLAYTLGEHISFAERKYDPASTQGQQLLAHELTHVVQQCEPTASRSWSREGIDGNPAAEGEAGMASGVHVIMRAPDTQPAVAPPPKEGPPASTPASKPASVPASPRTDVVLLGIDHPQNLAWSLTIAPHALVKKVGTADEMASALKSIKSPIGTLFVVLHGLPEGDLGFETGETTTYVMPSVIAAKIRGTLRPEAAPLLVDFRGCNIGTSPKAMDEMRAALGADAARGANCFVVIQSNGPISLGGRKITTPAQASRDPDGFDSGMKMLIAAFGKAQPCILDRSREAYFRAGGALVAEWVNAENTTEWDERHSKCFASLKPELADPTKGPETYGPGLAGDCKLLTVQKH